MNVFPHDWLVYVMGELYHGLRRPLPTEHTVKHRIADYESDETLELGGRVAAVILDGASMWPRGGFFPYWRGFWSLQRATDWTWHLNKALERDGIRP